MHAHGLYESGNDAENRHIIDKNMILFSSYTLMDGSSGWVKSKEGLLLVTTNLVNFG